MHRAVRGKPIVAGEVAALAICSNEPLSFWGGYDQATGEIIDRHHPLSGQIAARRALVLPHTRGSSTTTAVLLESVREGKAPAAVLTDGVDAFIALAAIVADELYGRTFVVLALDHADFETIETGEWLVIRRDGTIEVSPGPSVESYP